MVPCESRVTAPEQAACTNSGWVHCYQNLIMPIPTRKKEQVEQMLIDPTLRTQCVKAAGLVLVLHQNGHNVVKILTDGDDETTATADAVAVVTSLVHGLVLAETLTPAGLLAVGSAYGAMRRFRPDLCPEILPRLEPATT